MIEEINIKTIGKNQFQDITAEVQAAVDKSKLMNGVCYVFVMHTTAGITINENADPAVRSDIIKKLSDIIPPDAGYEHSEGNSDAHIKASMMGFSAVFPVEAGELVLGEWQGIYLCEFDGPRERSVLVKLIQGL
ncbi:MAG: secondary thiamine-phosphate synthase enzyme YjbQ [Candidatus Firestonebacteria bacterium]